MTDNLPTPDPNQALTDEQLLHQFCSGNQSALASLALRYEPLLLGLARGLLSGRDDLAADVVQDCWVRVIKYGKSFDERSSLRTWLYRMVVNRCHDLRALNAKSKTPASPPQEPESLELDEAQRVRAAIDNLDDRVRLILLLCFHRGLTHDQAAAVLEIPVGTLKSRLHAAMNQLRTALAEQSQRSQS